SSLENCRWGDPSVSSNLTASANFSGQAIDFKWLFIPNGAPFGMASSAGFGGVGLEGLCLALRPLIADLPAQTSVKSHGYMLCLDCHVQSAALDVLFPRSTVQSHPQRIFNQSPRPRRLPFGP